MKEVQTILHSFEQAQAEGRLTALATVVKTNGSVYRRPGARMLLTEDGQMIGAISGGCLESDVFERSQPLMFHGGNPIVVEYDTTGSDDIVWGLGLGCNGVVQVLIEPLTHPTTHQSLDFIAHCLDSSQPGVMATVFEVSGTSPVQLSDRLFLKPDGAVTHQIADAELAQQVLVDAQQTLQQAQSHHATYQVRNGTIKVFFEVVAPRVPLIVFGAGYDAVPVVNLAKQFGWHVTVVDHRSRYTTEKRFPNADRVILSQPHSIEQHLQLTPHTVAVIMTHHYLSDQLLLQTLLPSSVHYIGLLGPKTRTQQLLQALETQGYLFTPAQLHRLHAPVGLDIGAEDPEMIALSVLAEIQAVLSDRTGGSLKYRQGSIHTKHSNKSPHHRFNNSGSLSLHPPGNTQTTTLLSET